MYASNLVAETLNVCVVGSKADLRSLPKALSLGLSNSTGDRSDVPDVVIIVANSANKPSNRDIISVNRALTGPVYIILILVGDTGDTAWVGRDVTTIKVDRYDRLLDDLSDSLCQYLSDFVNRANGRPGVIRTPPSVIDLTRGRNLTVTLTTLVSVNGRGTTSDDGGGATAVSITESELVSTTANGGQLAGTTDAHDGSHGRSSTSAEAGVTGSGTGVAESGSGGGGRSTGVAESGPKTTTYSGKGVTEGVGQSPAGDKTGSITTSRGNIGGSNHGSSTDANSGLDGGRSHNGGSENAGVGTTVKGTTGDGHLGGSNQHTDNTGGDKEIERQMLVVQNDAAAAAATAATQSSKRPQIYRNQLTETDSVLGFAATTVDVSLAVPPAKDQFKENNHSQKTGQHALLVDHNQWSRQNSELTINDQYGGHTSKLAKTRTYADYDIVNVETGSHHDLQTADAMPPGSFVKNRRTGSSHDVGSLLEAFGFEDTDPVWLDITKNYLSVNSVNGQESEFKSIPVYPDGIYAKNRNTASTHDVRTLHNRLLASQAQKEHLHHTHSATANGSVAVDGPVKGTDAAASFPDNGHIIQSNKHTRAASIGGVYTPRKSTHMNKAVGDDRSFNANLRRDRGTMTPVVPNEKVQRREVDESGSLMNQGEGFRDS
uniref:Uncharacterized protein n=1 Tax=Romanomermis culicivorax TaxID=13658 RepID=A0A915KS75_ROMCU